MNAISFRRSVARILIVVFCQAQLTQAATLTLATTPLAATTTTTVRPNLMYVLDDSGSMGWDYTPDYINDATVTDPTNAGVTPPGSSGDRGTATIVGGVITGITATGGNVYKHATPTVLIQGDGTGASAYVVMNASRTIASVVVTSGGSGYTAAGTYVTFLGGLKDAGWGMCWGTTGTSNQGGTPKDTSSSPACTTRSQMPYSTAKVNYQFYDPAIRYEIPVRSDGTRYNTPSFTSAWTDGFSGAGGTNLSTSYEHEVWCSVATPSPAVTAANIATHAQCKENGDTSNNNLYPNATYSFRKTYNGPATYFNMEPSEYCTDTNYTSCITKAQALAAVPAFVISGVTYNVPSYYRWCAYYNPISKSFGNCQGRRDLDHYIPNYLGGWISATGAAAGAQSSANLVIGATTAGQQLNTVSVGGVNLVGSTTFTSAANGDQNTVATNVCNAIKANTATTGYGCAVSGATVTIQAAALGAAPNGLQVLATGPAAGPAANSEGEIFVTTATAGLTITSITVNSNQLLNANITADGNLANTARLICEGINSGAQQGVYIARSGEIGNLPGYGTCNTHVNAYVQIKRIPTDTTDNGAAIIVSGPANATVSSGSIQINSTGGSTSITDVTKDGVSIMSPKPLTIADGTQTTSIASSLATRLNGNGGCTATSSGNLVTITGCTGTLAVQSSSTLATGTMKVTSTGSSNAADLGGIQVSATSISGRVSQSTITNGTSVSANATSIRSAINAGTGTHGFSAAAPTANGDGTYNIVVTAPAGTAFNGQSYTFQNGTAVAGGVATSPTWNFTISNATANNAIIDYIRCDPSDSATNDEIYMLSTDATTGTATSQSRQRTNNLAAGLNGAAINGYSYSCSYIGGTGSNDQRCNVTGPTGASACTGDLTFTKDATITTKNYSKTAAVASCSAITPPTWTFQIGGTNASGGNNRKINSITCGGTDTINTNTVGTTTSTNGNTRRTNLGNGMQSNAINGYSYSCVLDAPNNRLNCTVTGPTAAAACTTLNINAHSDISINFNNNVSQTCPAITPANSATWQFEIDDATTDSKLFNSITCGGVNTITTNTVSTGTTTSNTVEWINNLRTGLQANAANGYTISCTTATTGTPTSACTITGPAGTNACQGTDTGDNNNCGVGQLSFKYDGRLDGSSGIDLTATGMTTPKTSDYVRACIPATSNGSSGSSAVDDFAPYLYTVSAFSGGAPAQGTTITQISSTSVGTVGVSGTSSASCSTPGATCNITVLGGMNNSGAASSINAIPTNATGTSPNVLVMANGADPVAASNRWDKVGIFKRYDIVNDGRTFSRAATRTDCAGATCSFTEESQNFANWYSYYRTRMLMMKSATTLAFAQLDGRYRIGFDNICQATGTTVDNPLAQFEGAARTSWWNSLVGATPSCATPLRAETAKIGRYYARKLNTTQADPMEYSCQQNYMLLVTDGYWNESESTAMIGVTGADIANQDNSTTTAPRPFYDGAQSSTTCPTVGVSRGSNESSCRTLADIAFHYYSTDLRTSALGNDINTSLSRDVSKNNVLTTADDKNTAQHMNFFAMGLGIEGKLAYRSDYQTALLGDYAEIVAGTKNWPAVANLDPTGVDDLWHATVNGRGKYFSARNVPNVIAGLREALNKIGARVGSAAAAATSNLEPVPGDNYAYIASYQTQDWVGDLQARTIDLTTLAVSPETNCTAAGVQTTISGTAGSTSITVSDATDLEVGASVSGTGIATGAVVSAMSGLTLTLSAANTATVSGTGTFKHGCQWSAQAKLDALTWSARRIYVKPSSAATGDPLRAFTYANLSGTERAYFNPGPDTCVGFLNPTPTTNLSQYCPLGGVTTVSEMTASNLVDFLRGNRALEQDGEVSHAQVWRKRAHVLGDIVNTQPIFVKAPRASYTDTGYSTFRSNNANRKQVVFITAQDGMLHAFNAYAGSVTVNGTPVGPGEEMWAFIPTEAMSNMKGLADVNYSHRFLVDGPISVGDVDFGGGDWHTILVGGMGAGGNTYFALDITDPTDPKYLWEFSHANLGKTYSNAVITKLPSGDWAVLFSSGYNNTAGGGDGMGHLFGLNPRTGALMTGFPISNGSGASGNPSNLGRIAAWADRPSINNTTRFVYVGDTNGDLWRFDMNPSADGHSGTQVFKLAHLERSGVVQPITTKPEITLLKGDSGQQDIRLLMVGTGKYLEVADLTDTSVQAVYAMKDTMGSANKGGSVQETWAPLTDTLPSDATKKTFYRRVFINTDTDGDPITSIDSFGVTQTYRMICAGVGSTVTGTGALPNKTYACNHIDPVTIDYSTYGGWYAELPESGERINVDPRIAQGTLIFGSNIPGADSCTVGGTSWLNYVNATTGLAVIQKAAVRISGGLIVGISLLRSSSGQIVAATQLSSGDNVGSNIDTSGAASTSRFQQRHGLWREFEVY
jgi:type IV pilus assembly protein PilY1